MVPMLWPIVLLLLGLLFVALELFIPSGGVLGFLAGASVVASVYVGFMQGPWYGVITAALALIFVPLAIIGALRIWPRTPIGRRLFLHTTEADVLPDNEQLRERQLLVGKFGTAKSKMLPSGAVQIEGRTYDAVSRGNPIEEGETIRVVAVQGNRIIVAPADPQNAPTISEPQSLAQPLEAFGIDPFDEPLA